MTTPTDTAPPAIAHHTWVIDHIAEQSAAVEVDGTSLMAVPLVLLPKDIHEGDVLRITREQQNDHSLLTIAKDDEERRRLANSQEQVAIVSKKDQPGDIVL